MVFKVLVAKKQKKIAKVQEFRWNIVFVDFETSKVSTKEQL